MAPPSDEIPHIEAKCGDCNYVYELNRNPVCPNCQSKHVAWAHLLKCTNCSDAGYVESERCEVCNPAPVDRWKTASNLPSVFEQGGIDELERMFALEDTRTQL